MCSRGAAAFGLLDVVWGFTRTSRELQFSSSYRFWILGLGSFFNFTYCLI